MKQAKTSLKMAVKIEEAEVMLILFDPILHPNCDCDNLLNSSAHKPICHPAREAQKLSQ